MPKIIKNGKEYSGVPIEVVTAWAPTADPVQVKEPLMGNTDISTIGDGTVTGAIDDVKTGLTKRTTVNVNNVYTDDITIVLGLKAVPFTNGNGSVSIADLLPSGKSFTSLAIANFQDTATLYVTGATVSGTTLSIRTVSSYSGTVNVTFIVFAK